MDGTEGRLSAIEASLESLAVKVGEVHRFICGNGYPERGMIVRLDRVERISKVLVWLSSILAVALIAVAVKSLWGI